MVPTLACLYLLDGLRAQDDFSGWDINTRRSSGTTSRACRWSCRWYQPLLRLVPFACGKAGCQTSWETFPTSELPRLQATGRQAHRKPSSVFDGCFFGADAEIYHPSTVLLEAMSGLLTPGDGSHPDRPEGAVTLAAKA